MVVFAPNSVLRNLAISVPVTFASGFTADSVAQAVVIKTVKDDLALNRVQKLLDGETPTSPTEVPEYSLRRAAVFASTGALLTGPASMLRLSLYDYLLPENRLFVEAPIKAAIEVFVFTPPLTPPGNAINEMLKTHGSLSP